MIYGAIKPNSFHLLTRTCYVGSCLMDSHFQPGNTLLTNGVKCHRGKHPSCCTNGQAPAEAPGHVCRGLQGPEKGSLRPGFFAKAENREVHQTTCTEPGGDGGAPSKAKQTSNPNHALPLPMGGSSACALASLPLLEGVICSAFPCPCTTAGPCRDGAWGGQNWTAPEVLLHPAASRPGSVGPLR